MSLYIGDKLDIKNWRKKLNYIRARTGGKTLFHTVIYAVVSIIHNVRALFGVSALRCSNIRRELYPSLYRRDIWCNSKRRGTRAAGKFVHLQREIHRRSVYQFAVSDGGGSRIRPPARSFARVARPLENESQPPSSITLPRIWKLHPRSALNAFTCPNFRWQSAVHVRRATRV